MNIHLLSFVCRQAGRTSVMLLLWMLVGERCLAYGGTGSDARSGAAIQLAAASSPPASTPQQGIDSVAALLTSGKYAEAEKILRDTIARLERQQGSDASMGNALIMLARALRMQNKATDAVAPVAQFQGALTKSYHDNYKRITGYSADSAWQAITTTTAHNEAFKDVAVLTGNIGSASKGWAGQTADVIRYKTDLPNMERANASFSQYTRQQESARGLAKEIQTKVEPALMNAKPSSPMGTPEHAAQVERILKTQQHLREVNQICNDFGQGKIDPLTFNQKLSQLTGGKSLSQVADHMGTIFEAAVKFKNK